MPTEATTAPAVEPHGLIAAKNLLHLNLNTVDLDIASQFYVQLLGLDLRMKSGADDGDWRFHGIQEPVSSAGWFLYDDRGPRTSPALELVGWHRPATAGAAYGQFAHRGLGSVRFSVPSLDGLAAATTAGGGEVVGPIGAEGLLIRDTYGVYVELQPDPHLSATGGGRLSSARIGCADLDESLQWYADLGFAAVGEPAETELEIDGKTLRLRSVAVALPNASITLELTQWLDPVATEPAESRLWYRGMVRMAISVEDLDAAMAALSAGGWTVPEPIYFALPGTPIGGLRVLFLTDPDGLTVELVHRPSKHFVRAAAE
jgi:catechol 2,3-dioxygenase-like lactoylglutathione lyase family enzyme